MKAFADVATAIDTTPTAFGVFSLVSLSPNKGWIVARGVDGKLVPPTDLEARVRELTSEVNARVAETPLLGQNSASTGSWPAKVRASLAKASAVVSGLGLSSPGGDADAASSP